MMKLLRWASLPLIVVVALLAPEGGGLGANRALAGETPRNVADAQVPTILVAQRGRPSPARGSAGGAGATPSSKEIMSRLTKGPSSLTPVIGNELAAGQPPWET